MKIEIDKSEKEMIDFLRINGYTVKKEKHTICHSVYHNDVECNDVEIWAVYKNKKAFSFYSKENWLKDAFESIFQEKLYNIVKNFKI